MNKEKYTGKLKDSSSQEKSFWRGLLKMMLIISLLVLAIMAWSSGLIWSGQSFAAATPTPLPEPTATAVVVTPTPEMATAADLEQTVEDLADLEQTAGSLDGRISELENTVSDMRGELTTVRIQRDQTAGDLTKVRDDLSDLQWKFESVLLVFVCVVTVSVCVWYLGERLRVASPQVEQRPARESAALRYLPPIPDDRQFSFNPRRSHCSVHRLATAINDVWDERPHLPADGDRELFERAYQRLFPYSDPPSYAGSWFYKYKDAMSLIEMLSTTATTTE